MWEKNGVSWKAAPGSRRKKDDNKMLRERGLGAGNTRRETAICGFKNGGDRNDRRNTARKRKESNETAASQ